MSDSETPQPDPERHGAPDPSAGTPANSAPEPVNGAPEQDSQSPAPSAAQPQSTPSPAQPQGTNGGSQPTTPAPSRHGLGRVKHLLQSRPGVYAALAVLCIAGGTVGSVLGAHAVAHSDGAKTETSFHQGSQAIASTLKLAIQRQEELTVAAATYFAANPKASAAEFAVWVTWARTRRRYPELDALGLLPAPPKPAPVKASSSSPVKASSSPVKASATPVKASPSPAPVHISPALLLSRNTGLSTYHPIAAGHRQALAIVTPVYRGNVTPHTVFGRTAASVGWLREVTCPGPC